MAIAPRTIQAPPELPDLTGVPPALIHYLRQHSLWCRHGFADKLSGSTAQPGVMLLAHDAAPGTNPPVFNIQVNSAGTVVATPMPLGQGKP